MRDAYSRDRSVGANNGDGANRKAHKFGCHDLLRHPRLNEDGGTRKDHEGERAVLLRMRLNSSSAIPLCLHPHETEQNWPLAAS